ncbi:MAG: sigma-70 family RNA polymerase sigma factor [Chamaesiphon sp.]
MSFVTAGVFTDDHSDKDADTELVKRCLQGDQQSFRKLYRRYQQKVRSTLYQLCGPSSLDDLVQEVFLRTWKGLPKWQQKAKFSTWIYRITWNVASDQRQEFAQKRSQLQKIAYAATTESEGPSVEHLHYEDLVQRGLAQLSFEHRTVLVMHDLEELPQKEVAQILGIPVGTVKSRLFHARGTIRKFLQQEGVQL